MSEFPPPLPEAVARFHATAREIRAAAAARSPSGDDALKVEQLIEALGQFFAILENLGPAPAPAPAGSAAETDASELGEYGLTLLTDLIARAGALDLAAARAVLEQLSLSIADWIMRHRGEIRALEPVVNGLAGLANELRAPRALEALAGFMGRVIGAVPEIVRHDLESSSPGRPWRVLHLNLGIVATRSHNPALMEQVFDELVRCLPSDAARFFAEGMEQMEALDYPPPVRRVMTRYFERWTRPTMH